MKKEKRRIVCINDEKFILVFFNTQYCSKTFIGSKC